MTRPSEPLTMMLSVLRPTLITLFAAVLSAPAAANDVLVPSGSSWSFLDDGSLLPATWSDPGFPDGAWASGSAQLGYGDGDEATVVDFGPNPNDKHLTTYFRQAFTVANPGLYLGLEVRLLRDDGALVWLNGVELVRDNLPSGTIDGNSTATQAIGGDDEDRFYRHYVPASALQSGSNVLAVEIHQSSSTSSDISFDLELVGLSEVSVVRGPYLQRGSHEEVTVKWRTDVAVQGRVFFGAAPGALTDVADAPAPALEHVVTLPVEADTAYAYAVGTPAGVLVGDDAEHVFVTSPEPGTEKPTRIWVLGDSGTADSLARGVRDAYYAYTGTRATDLWLMLGDNAYDDGTDFEYQDAVFDTYPDMLRKSVLWSTRGNHERTDDVYYDVFELPTDGRAGGMPSGTEAYYAFDYANIHFVCLDSYGSDRSIGGPMWLWLREDLAAHEQDWLIAFWHHPPYSKGSHDSDVELELREMRTNFLPLLEDGGVDLVLGGHSHSYERSFLIDGHYTGSAGFEVGHLKNPGDGRTGGDGPYAKVPQAHAGTVYCVAGSSGKFTNAILNHPAMFYSMPNLGSLVIDVDGGRMDVKFLRETGAIDDEFTLLTFPDEGLGVDRTTIAANGVHRQRLFLDAGPEHSNETYVMVGSATGPADVPFGSYGLPLVPDRYTSYVLARLNSPMYTGFFGILDAEGRARATLDLPLPRILSVTGRTLYHSYVSFGGPGLAGPGFVSNAVPVTFVFAELEPEDVPKELR